MSKSSNFFGQPIYGQLIKSLDREKIVEISRKHGGEKYVKSCVLKDTARCLFSRSKRFEQPRKALAPAGGWACPPKSGSLVNLRCLCHKKDELKQLKSELAALDRKIQLELAPPTQEAYEKEKDGQEVKPDSEGVRNVSPQHTENAPQIRSPMDERSPSGNFIADHIIIGRPGFQFKDENRTKGMKI